MKLEAIAFDLDDTLLNGQSSISDYTVEVLRRAKARGIRIIPASGRAPYSMKPYVDRLGAGDPYIACNGAEIVGPDHQALETFAFSPERARAVCRWLKESGSYVQVYRGENFFYAEDCEASRNYQRSSGMIGKPVGDLDAFLTFETPKVLSVNTPAEVARILPLAQAAFPDVEFTVSKPYFLEAQPQGVNKGAALVRLAKRLGLNLSGVMAFGDSLNDVKMLQAAGHGVAMGNARDEVKRAVPHVCGSNLDDGVAKYVQAHVLGGDDA